MAARPNINNILSFDATMGTTVSFSLSGNVSYGNKIFVYDTETMDLVYQYPDALLKQKSPVQLSCVIPASTLRNGKRYSAQVQTVDVNNTLSQLSDKKTFYCLSSPTFAFANVRDGDVINSSFFDAIVSYDQPNGEKLQSYRFSMYDRNRVLITESTLLYDTQNMTYRFKRMATNETYYFRCTGTTIRGLVADTGFIEVTASYTVKQDYAMLNLENHYFRGYISYSTNIRLIGYNLNNDDYLFVAHENVDLTGRNPDYKNQLVYDNGFMIDGNWTAWIKLYGANGNTDVLTYSNDAGQKIVIGCYRYDDGVRFKLTVTDGVTEYIRYTNVIVWSTQKYYTIFVRRVGQLFDFYLYDGNQAASGDYSLYQNSNGDLMLRYEGALPSFKYVAPSLYTGEDDVTYDHATGNLYKRVF